MATDMAETHDNSILNETNDNLLRNRTQNIILKSNFTLINKAPRKGGIIINKVKIGGN